MYLGKILGLLKEVRLAGALQRPPWNGLSLCICFVLKNRLTTSESTFPLYQEPTQTGWPLSFNANFSPEKVGWLLWFLWQQPSEQGWVIQCPEEVGQGFKRICVKTNLGNLVKHQLYDISHQELESELHLRKLYLFFHF